MELLSKLYEIFLSGKRTVFPDGMVIMGDNYPFLIETPWKSGQYVVFEKNEAERLRVMCERVLEVAKKGKT